MIKFHILYEIIIKLIHHPYQILHYLSSQKIMRVIFYYKNGGLKQVSRILDERLLMGADLKLEIHLDKPVNGKKIEDYPQLEFPQIKHPMVSIIIPAYNQFDFTYNCLRSILKNTDNVDYEILVADDCSTDMTVEIEKIAKNIKHIVTPENCLFLKNCNYAAKKACGKYLLFLNNDTQVQKNWLSSLVKIMETNPLAGLVGSKLVYPDGKLQEAGGILWNDGCAWNYGNGKNPALPEYHYVKEVDYISGAAIMTSKKIWEYLGGFDERFSPAYCEDSDFALSIRNTGYQVLLQPASVVVHFEGVSNGVDISTGVKSNQIRNQAKLFDKWEDILMKQNLPNGTDVFLARDRSQLKKRILIIDHMVPRYDRDAGAKNVYMYTRIFLELGMKVTFLPADYFPMQPYTEELEQLGVEVLYGNYYMKYCKEWLAENTGYYDYIYVNRPQVGVVFMDLVKRYAKGKIIYFGHDLHYLREQREYEIEKKPELLPSIQRWKELELHLMDSADVIYVVGDYEQAIIQKEFPEKPVRNIPIFTYDPLADAGPVIWKERKDLLFVGGFNHPPNIDAVLWFAHEIFPVILEHYPKIKWYVIGSNPTEEILALQSEHIIITGFVTDEQLKMYYKTCRLVVVPLRYGAGVKGKVIESIYYQCPLITTPIGAEGISTAEHAFAIAPADKAMANKIIELYENEMELQDFVDKSSEYINRYYTRESALNMIAMDIS